MTQALFKKRKAMKVKQVKFLISYFIITMAWAYPWHVIWFHEKYKAWGAITREHPIMWMGISAIIIQGIVIGYLYPFILKQRENTIFQAIKFNLIIGLMTYTAMGFATAAKVQIEPASDFLIFHTIFQFIQFTLTGIALGFIYRSKSK